MHCFVKNGCAIGLLYGADLLSRRCQERTFQSTLFEGEAAGTKLDRPGLQAAIDLARDGCVDLLLVYRVDRLSRKVRQLAQLADELDIYQVVLRSATEPFDTGSAAGRMMLQMLAVFAEFEHATIVDRVSAGIERRAKEGRSPASRRSATSSPTSSARSCPTR